MKKAITLFILLSYFAISSCSYSSQKSREMLIASQGKSYDIIIVPGVPFEDEKWSDVMKTRVYWSKYLFDRGIAKNIMYSGGAVYTPYFEAKIMALYGEALGIPRQNILTEIKAEHSTENIYYSYKKARSLGFKSIALATDPFQSKMVRKFIKKKMKVDIPHIPIVYDSLEKIEMLDPEIEFRLAFAEGFISIKEREGFWKRLNGTRGNNIDTTLYNFK